MVIVLFVVGGTVDFCVDFEVLLTVVIVDFGGVCLIVCLFALVDGDSFLVVS